MQTSSEFVGVRLPMQNPTTSATVNALELALNNFCLSPTLRNQAATIQALQAHLQAVDRESLRNPQV